jgi:hypothetical protein
VEMPAELHEKPHSPEVVHVGFVTVHSSLVHNVFPTVSTCTCMCMCVCVCVCREIVQSQYYINRSV